MMDQTEVENDYGGSEHENKIQAESHEESEVTGGTAPKRSHDDERHKEQALRIAAVLHDIFGDFDDQQTGHEEHSVQNQINQVDNVCKSTDNTGSHVKELIPSAFPLKRKAVSSPHPDQMAIFRVSKIIGIDPNPFDPSTYVDKDLYVTYVSGSKRLIPPANIIRWRQVSNSDGKTKVESNARFVTWSDGSLQLLIGNEAFDVSEQDITHMESHLFLKHKEGILSAQGKVSKRLVVMPASLSSRSHLTLAAQVNSKNQKISRVKHCITEVDPEWKMEQNLKTERQNVKANRKKKKVMPKNISMHHQLCDVPTLLMEYPDGEWPEKAEGAIQPYIGSDVDFAPRRCSIRRRRGVIYDSDEE